MTPMRFGRSCDRGARGGTGLGAAAAAGDDDDRDVICDSDLGELVYIGFSEKIITSSDRGTHRCMAHRCRREI